MTRDLLRAALLCGVCGTASACSTREGETSGERSPLAAIGLQSDSTPDYSVSAGPGGQIVFARVIDGLSNVFIADSTGGNARRLTDGIWDFEPRWSPDGKYIAFNREVSGNDVLVVPVDSGPARVLVSTAAEEVLVGWLPDASGVVYRKFGTVRELWQAKLDGTTTRLVDVNASVDGMISPDGKSLGYSRLDKGRRTLWVQDLATRATRQLTTEGYESIDDAFGMWSPDSRRFLYLSTRSGTADVWSVNVADGTTRQLTRDIREDYRPLYSPDGQRVSFISQRGGQTDVWVVADSGGEPTRVTDTREIEELAEWTHDSRAVLIMTRMGQAHLYRASVDGGAPQRLVNEANMEEYGFSMSADGSQLAFTSTDGVNLDVRAVASSGGASVLVAGGPADDVTPSISPDGKQVVFSSNRAGNFDLYVTTLGSDSARRLLDWPSAESQPQWSPDGKWIAFVSSRVSDDDIWLVHPDGSGAHQLTTTRIITSDNRSDFRWSHDSRHIAYTTPVPAGSAVQIVDVASGERRTIVTGEYTDGVFWPGDSLIAVAKLSGGLARIELRRVRDGSLVQPLSPTEGNVYERGGVASPHERSYAFYQFTFKGNDYPLAVRNRDGSNTRVLTSMRGSARHIHFLPDGKTLVTSFFGDIPRMSRHPLPQP